MQLKRLIVSFLTFETVITFADKQHMLKLTEVAHKNIFCSATTVCCLPGLECEKAFLLPIVFASIWIYHSYNQYFTKDEPTPKRSPKTRVRAYARTLVFGFFQVL